MRVRSLSRFIDSNLTLAALQIVMESGQAPRGFIHHSDRGVQYASGEYVETLESAGVRISTSAKGNPYDDAKAESFFKTSKQDELRLKRYERFEEAGTNIGCFIDNVYNQKWLQWGNNWYHAVTLTALHWLEVTEAKNNAGYIKSMQGL